MNTVAFLFLKKEILDEILPIRRGIHLKVVYRVVSQGIYDKINDILRRLLGIGITESFQLCQFSLRTLDVVTVFRVIQIALVVEAVACIQISHIAGPVDRVLGF